MDTNERNKIDLLIENFLEQEVIYEPQLDSFRKKISLSLYSPEGIKYFTEKLHLLCNIGKDHRIYLKANPKPFNKKGENAKKQGYKNSKGNKKDNEPKLENPDKTIYKRLNIKLLSQRMHLPVEVVIEELLKKGIDLQPNSFLNSIEYKSFLAIYGRRIKILKEANYLEDIIVKKVAKQPKKRKIGKWSRHKSSTNLNGNSVYDKIGSAGGVGKLIFIRSK
jgi:hypothetical protein